MSSLIEDKIVNIQNQQIYQTSNEIRTFNDFIESDILSYCDDNLLEEYYPFEYSMRNKYHELLKLLDKRLYNWMNFIEDKEKLSTDKGDILLIYNPFCYNRIQLNYTL